jgi:acyl-CoA dehydrogenase
MNAQIEMNKLLQREPPFEDISCSLNAIPGLPKAIAAETAEVVAIARKFNDEVVRPRALELDRKMHEDPGYLPWEFVEEANRRGFYTMWVPRLFGGKGYNMPSLSCFLEEVSTGCVAMANLIGVHYLGVGTLCASWNMRVMNKVLREVAEGERTGKPCLISLAITEPSAGTDTEEVELVDKGKVTGSARKVEGGHVVNANKIFISSGHVSTWHMLIVFSDVKKPSENVMMFAVRNGTKGFSFGRMENKMGQKVCPASELIFEDCFVPDELTCIDVKDTSVTKGRPAHKVSMQVIDYVVSTSRAGVCAFATGVARGAFEEAVKFAAETEINGKPMINQEWVQSRLAEMYKNVAISRMAYMETNYANGLYGLFRLLMWKPFYYYLRYAPNFVMDRIVSPIIDMPIVTRIMRILYFDRQVASEYERTSGLASLAKFLGSEMGTLNCQLALEMMGQAGLRQDHRVEKMLRDSKLLQIYEGTNQLNRLNLFKCLIGRQFETVKMFEEGQAEVRPC